MGSRFFAHCDIHERFRLARRCPRFGGGLMWLVYDWDQRRCVDVHVGQEVDEKVVLKAVEQFLNDLPAGVVQVEISKEGTLLSSSSDPTKNRSWVPFYPPRTDFPRHVATIRRRDLTEVDRLGLQVDLTTYTPKRGEAKQVVFKYYITEESVASWWHEANCVMRMPRHPNIVSFDALVVDRIEGVDRVVGFTTHYVHGGTISENKDRVFKLKYLEQLISVVDHLNLRLGIVHGDICPWNLLIDPETDNILLFDFNFGAKLGWEGDKDNRFEFEYEKDRNDVKFVIFTMYELITRKYCFRREFYPHELDASIIMKKPKWVKHRNVRLDSPVEEYRRVLSEWFKRRNKVDKKVDHFTKASTPLEWPPLQVSPDMAWDNSPLRRRGEMRMTLIELGKDFLKWERPPTQALPLPSGQHLLATGDVIRDD